MSKDDSSAGIEVILRICPSDNPSGYIAFDDIEENAVIFQVPKTEDTIVNNSRTRYGFRFNDILQEKATQNDAFRIIGAPAVRNVLQGFNSTVFAYGQTGSGKTYTITGGPERYSDRGIIPRAISMLFAGFQEQQNDTTYCAYISYLELYNETGYDLLVDESTVAKSKGDESLKVTMLEDDIGNYHFRNLSVNPVSSEEEALNFLFLGDTNRAIGETEMNLSSSRSHCIFTILVEARKRGSDTVIRSKLNLVDLAGSERVHKTNSTGQTLREAQHINASLFYLEMVIVALYERSKKGKESTHIPYRNSMMTSVLRDSLGGNCKTIMVATISPEAKQTDESISTCHFAQRVALIKNNAQINEELEPELVIQRLKSEVKRLREEIRYLKGENGEGDELSKDQTTELEEAIALYLKGDGNSQLNIGTMTLTKIQAAFGVFRDIIWNKGSEGNSGETTIVPSEIKDQREMNKTIEKLQCDLKERNEEIEVLVQMVKEGKGIGKGGGLNIPSHEEKVEQGILDAVNETTKKKSMNDRKVRGVERCVDADILNEPAKAFQWFQDRYPGVQAIEENKKLLNGKYLEAKETGEVVKKAKALINTYILTIEKIRCDIAMRNVMTEGDSKEDQEEEIEYRRMIEEEKTSYKNAFKRLKDLKAVIEQSKGLLKKSRVKLQSDFDAWYKLMCDRAPTLSERIIESANTDMAKAKEDTAEAKEDLFQWRSFQNLQNETREKEIASHPSENIPNMVKESINSSEAKFRLPPGARLTGNKEADDDIVAFYKAKEALMARTRNRASQKK